MSDTLSRYQILGSKGQPVGTPYEDYHEAERAARRGLDRFAIEERIYRFEDTDLVFTSDGSREWPNASGHMEHPPQGDRARPVPSIPARRTA